MIELNGNNDWVDLPDGFVEDDGSFSECVWYGHAVVGLGEGG